MNKDTSRFCTGRISRTAIAFLVAWTTIDPVFAQDTQAPSQQAPSPQTPSPQPPAQAQTRVYSLTDLEYLLGPIALYPDPLLTLVLTASAFPLQIVQADRWIVDNSDAVKQNDFTKVDGMSAGRMTWTHNQLARVIPYRSGKRASPGAWTPIADFRFSLPSRANASDAARWGIWNPILSSHPECAGRQNRLPACRCCRSPPIPGHDRTEPWKLDAT